MAPRAAVTNFPSRPTVPTARRARSLSGEASELALESEEGARQRCTVNMARFMFFYLYAVMLEAAGNGMESYGRGEVRCQVEGRKSKTKHT